MKKIGARAFAGCEGLSNVIIPKGGNKNRLTYILCMLKFKKCNLANWCLEAADDAFEKCDSLEAIFVPTKKTNYYKKRLPSELWDKIIEIDSKQESYAVYEDKVPTENQ